MNRFFTVPGAARRLVAFVFVAALSGLIGHAIGDESQPVVKLERLLHTPLEVWDGGEVIVTYVDLPAGAELPPHIHPGEEFVYILEGSGVGWQDGEEIPLEPGDLMHVPYRMLHTARPGPEGAKAIVFRVHEKGQPERIMPDAEGGADE